MNKTLCFLTLLSAFAAAGAPAAPDGDAPVWTSDGSILFQRQRGEFLELACADASFGNVRTLASADKMFFGHPAAGPNGEVVCIGYSLAQTSYEKGVGKSDLGANLYLVKDGALRRLTYGRQFESTPSFGPDGKVYYSSADLETMRGVPGLFRIDPKQEKPKRELLYLAPAYHSTGVSQPVVSPDGRLLAWSELDGWDDTWSLRLSWLEDRTSPCVITPVKMWAYSPRWCADSRHLVFTGFQAGDPTWCVYVVDAKTGSLTRLFPGTEPCVSADGRTIVYSENGVLRKAPFAIPADTGLPLAAAPGREGESVLLSRENVPNGTMIDLDGAFAFGRDKTAFVRIAFVYDGDYSGLQDFACLEYGETSRGLDLYLGRGQPHFATRDGLNAHFRIATGTRFRASRGVMTGIRTAEGLFLLVEGDKSFTAVYQKRFTRDNLALNTPKVLAVGKQLPSGSRVVKVEVGTGWPTNVPKPLDMREVFK